MLMLPVLKSKLIPWLPTVLLILTRSSVEFFVDLKVGAVLTHGRELLPPLVIFRGLRFFLLLLLLKL